MALIKIQCFLVIFPEWSHVEFYREDVISEEISLSVIKIILSVIATHGFCRKGET